MGKFKKEIENSGMSFTEGGSYNPKEKEEIYLDLSKCTEEEQKHVFSLLPTEKDLGDYTVDQDFKYLNFDIPMDRWFVDNNEYENKTELTYPEFIKLFEGGEGEKTYLNKDDIEFITEALNFYFHDAHKNLERTVIGDIEKKNYQYQLEKAKELIKKLTT